MGAISCEMVVSVSVFIGVHTNRYKQALYSCLTGGYFWRYSVLKVIISHSFSILCAEMYCIWAEISASSTKLPHLNKRFSINPDAITIHLCTVCRPSIAYVTKRRE